MQPANVTIETERLIMRPTQLEDFERWAELISNEDAARYIGGTQPRAIAYRSFLSMAGSWALTGVGMFSLIEKSTRRWVGRTGPWFPLEWPAPEVGWSLHPDAWGKGYATEAALVAMDYAFDVLGWDDVIHSIDPANEPSKRVAQRLGSTFRGPGKLPPPHHEAAVEIWGQTREQWRRRARG